MGCKRSKAKSPEMSRLEASLDDGRLPDWYSRVVRLAASRKPRSWDEDYEPKSRGKDFDEDISDIASEEDDFECDCSSDKFECDCEPDQADQDEFELENEYPLYAEYKEMRNERKHELERRRQIKERAIAHDRAQEEVVEKAWAKAKEREAQGVKGPKLKLKSTHFKIYSSEYIRSPPWDDDTGTMYVEFYLPYEEENPPSDRQLRKSITGHVYLDGCNSRSMKPFRAPRRAELSGISIDIQESSRKLNSTVTITFIDQDFLKITIAQHIANTNVSLSNDKYFEFVGIRLDLEKQRKRKRQAEEEIESRRQRQTSPRESWFEMNHPMGWWAQSRWGH